MTASITVHVAVVEWNEDLDVEVFVERDVATLCANVRTHIEEMIEATVPSFLKDVRAWVTGPGAEVQDWDEWYDEIHEISSVPWVTFTQREVPVQ